MREEGREFVEHRVADNAAADSQREVEDRDPGGDELAERCLAG